MRWLVLIATYLTGLQVSAQTVFFKHITREQGLTNGNVRAVVKDHQGFIWIGTEDGLHRFDGYSMRVYRNSKADSTTLGSNFVLTVFEDSHQTLWVGTLDGGLYGYDRDLDGFKKVHLPKPTSTQVSVAVRSIREGADNYLYVGADNLSRSKVGDLASMHFEKVPLPCDSSQNTGKRVAAIAQYDESTLLVSVNTQGLYTYNTTTGIASQHPIGELEKYIVSIYVDKHRNLIWTGSWRDGIVVYNPVDHTHKRIRAGNDSLTLRNNFVVSIAGDAVGNTWMATDYGLSMIPGSADPFNHCKVITYLPGQTPTGIHGDIFKTVFVDDQDKVWAGAYYEGLNVYDKNSMNFGSLMLPANDKRVLDNWNVNAVQEDKAGNLWLGLDGGGLHCLRGEFDETRPTTIEQVIVNQNIDKIKSLKMDDDQNLWIGTWGNGLVVLDTRTRQARKIDPGKLGFDWGNEIVSLNADRSGNLWVGSFDKGLFRYSLENGEIQKIESGNIKSNLVDRINTIYVDSLDNVWIGRDAGGLNLLPKGESTYKGIQTDLVELTSTVYGIYRSRSGTLWVGLPNLGLVAYDVSSNQSHLYGEDRGLANSSVYAILEDQSHRLWVSHNAGLSVFDPATERFTNFSDGHGLTAAQFNKGSAVKHKGGDFVFGNIRGINYFNPADFKKRNGDARVVFTKFFINNTEQKAGSDVLPKNIVVTREVYLNHDQNSFSIEAAAMDTDLSNPTHYYYRLDGFDKAWQHAGPRRLISYTNIPPGSYTLNVKTDEQNSAHENIQSLQIVIIAAWWQTLWFKTLLIFMIAIAAFAVHRMKINFFIVQKELLEKQVEIRTEKLNTSNEQLQSANALLKEQRNEIVEKNNEIQAQNEELLSQNEQIVQQQEGLIRAQEQLTEINAKLELTVQDRTEKLQHTIRDLNKTVFELDRFVYSASHDLSAPLKSIRGLVEIIKIEKDPDKVVAYVELIRKTVLKLETVIQSMIDYARNTHVIVKSEPCLLREMIDEITSELAFWPDASGINFVNNVPDDFRVYTDRARIKVVLHNLISNGIKYSDKSKNENWMKFDSRRDGDAWQLRIEDNGIGIRKEYMDKVFNMYFRATESSKGSGLGLFIVKETLRKLGASVSIDSVYGDYTVFEINAHDINTDDGVPT